MRLLHRPLRAGGAAVLGLATIALTGAFAASGAQASTAAPAAATPAGRTLCSHHAAVQLTAIHTKTQPRFSRMTARARLVSFGS